MRRRAAKSKEKELELNVSICIEDELPDDPEILVYICFFFINGYTHCGLNYYFFFSMYLSCMVG